MKLSDYDAYFILSFMKYYFQIQEHYTSTNKLIKFLQMSRMNNWLLVSKNKTDAEKALHLRNRKDKKSLIYAFTVGNVNNNIEEALNMVLLNHINMTF